MSFTLPTALKEVLDRATTIPLAGINLRFRMPNSRDTANATKFAEDKAKGQVSFEAGYIYAILASCLIGMDDKPISSYHEDESIKKLCDAAPESLSDDDFAKLFQEKLPIIYQFPGESALTLYRTEFMPWINEGQTAQEKQLALDVAMVAALKKRRKGSL